MIYFDNSATTKPFSEVIDSFVKVSNDYFGNPSSLHNFGGISQQLLSQARSQTARLLQVKAHEIYFTSGGTEGNNIAIKGTAFSYMNRGRHLITTEIEHPSVKESFKQLGDFGFDVTFLPVDSKGRVDVKDVEKAIREDTILVSIMHVNNEVGSIQPIKEIGRILHSFSNILFHVDYVQGIGKVPLSIKDCHIDLCTMSGHKFHALKGNGLLFIREGVKINPLFTGGGQEKNLRSGTENVAGAVSQAKALRMILEKYQNEKQSLQTISNALRKGLSEIDGVVINTPEENTAPHIINFSIFPIKSEVFVHALEEKGMFVSTTSACSSKQKSISSTLLAMGVSDGLAESSIRISLSYFNTMDEVNKALTVMKATVEELGKVMK